MRNIIANTAHYITRPQFVVGLFVLWFALTFIGVAISLTRAVYTMRQNTPAYVPTHIATSDTFISERVLPTRVVIPALGTDLPVDNPQTDDIDTLNDILTRAVARYNTSGTIGTAGKNMLIFGHSSYLPVVRNQLYKAFNGIQDLVVGDEVHVYGDDGVVYSYAVVDVQHANATEDSVPIEVAQNTSTLTLLTCDTFGQKTDRWMVTAQFLGTQQ